MSRLSELHAQLNDEWRALNSQWQGTGALWQDDSRSKVEGAFWNSLEKSVPPALRELEELIQLFAALERRVEP